MLFLEMVKPRRRGCEEEEDLRLYFSLLFFLAKDRCDKPGLRIVVTLANF
jgi:hypothetical protein